MIYDTLSQMESYQTCFRNLAFVISILDRSLPYDKPDGSYVCEENRDVTYVTQSYVTSSKGLPFTVKKGECALLAALDGECLVSTGDSSAVFKVMEGSFILLTEGEYKKGLSANLPSGFREVHFSFPA